MNKKVLFYKTFINKTNKIYGFIWSLFKKVFSKILCFNKHIKHVIKVLGHLVNNSIYMCPKTILHALYIF